MEITTKTIGDVMVLKLHGHMNIETSEQFKSTAFALLEKGKQKLLLDCSLLEYVSSAGIQALYVVLDKVDEVNGKIAICSPNEDVAKVFDMVDLQSDISIYPSQQAAIKDL